MSQEAPLVLNTRPRAQATELTRALEAAGLRVLEAPTVEIVPAWTRERVAQALRRLRAGAYAWTVVPSANAARFLLDALGEVGGGPADLSRTQILCGAATGATLEARGVPPATVLHRFSAAAALRTLGGLHVVGGAVLLPRSRDGREELAEGLRARGVRVDDLALYETRPVPAAALRKAAAQLASGEVAAVTFASPTSVQGLLRAVQLLGGDASCLSRAALVCIGETTAEAVRSAGLRVASVAGRTTAEALAGAAARVLLPADGRHPGAEVQPV